MKKEVTAKAPTIDQAVEKAIAELGLSRDDCQIEVLETPRKSLFGKLKEAVVRVSAEIKETGTPAMVASSVSVTATATGEKSTVSRSEKAVLKLETAQDYLKGIFQAMKLPLGPEGVQIRITEHEEGATLTLDGEGIAVLIGHHGETLDALQYLVALTCNRVGGEYYRITLDCGNYREKREVTLRALAARIASKVKKTGRSQLLEPMNPYERRIIHSVVSEIEGVTSKSKGEEPNRRVVIMSETPARPAGNREFGREEYRNDVGNRSRDTGNNDRAVERDNRPRQRELTMEEILKSDFKQKEEKAELYSKIEL